MKKELMRKIIDNNRFSNRKISDPDFCPCYNGTKCHNIAEDKLICLFCYCPEYQIDLEFPEGRCRINSSSGTYFHHPELPPKGIWDCSNCTIPQTENYAKQFLRKMSLEQLGRFQNIEFRMSKEMFDFLIKNVSQE